MGNFCIIFMKSMRESALCCDWLQGSILPFGHSSERSQRLV